MERPGPKIVSQKHPKLLLQNIHEYQKQGKFCDMLLRASDGTCINAHSAVVFGNSSTMSSLLSNDGNETPVVHTDIDLNTLKCVVNYMYTGELNTIDGCNVEDVLSALKSLGLDEAAETCETYLSQKNSEQLDKEKAEENTHLIVTETNDVSNVVSYSEMSSMEPVQHVTLDVAGGDNVVLKVTHQQPMDAVQKASRAFHTARYMGNINPTKPKAEDKQIIQNLNILDDKIEEQALVLAQDQFVNEVHVTTDGGDVTATEVGDVMDERPNKRLRLDDLCDAVERSLNEEKEDEEVGERLFKCGICGIGSSSFKDIENHMNMNACKRDEDVTSGSSSSNSGKPERVSFPLQQFFTREERIELLAGNTPELGAKTQREVYICTLCGKSLSSAWGYRLHMKRHESNREIPRESDFYICGKCHKTFNSSWELECHGKVHAGKTRNFKCANCDMRFMRRKHLLEHFESRECWNAFVTEDVARRIAKSEEQELAKTIRCRPCNIEFEDRESLAVHTKSLHPDSLVCDICNTTTASTRALKEHKAGAHGGSRYACEICGKTFRWRSGRIDHMRKVSEVKVTDFQHGFPLQSHGVQSVRNLKSELEAILPATLEEVEQNVITIIPKIPQQVVQEGEHELVVSEATIVEETCEVPEQFCDNVELYKHGVSDATEVIMG